MSSVLDEILDAAVSIVSGLNLVDSNNNPMSVQKRYLPRRQVGIDPVPLCTVYRDETPEDLGYYTFGSRKIRLKVYIVIVSQGNQDLLSNIALYDEWREQIFSAFLPANLPTAPPLLPSVPSVFDIRVVPDVWLPRGTLNQNYDYQGIGVNFTFIQGS